MKIIEMKCSSCGGVIKIMKGDRYAICQHCGNAYYYDDGNRTLTINKNVKIEKNISKIDHTRLAEIESQKAEKLAEIEKEKFGLIASFIFLFTWFLLFILYIEFAF